MPAAPRLKIGLSACFQHADPNRPLFTGKTLQYVEQSIAHWLMSAGAMVVMVPCPTGETARGDVTLAHYAEWLDGVVMHGGADVWPGNYGEEPLREEWVGDRVRDLYDLAVVKAFAEVRKPIFGVCRGLQLINVAFGGALYQDIEFQHPGAQQHRNASTYDQHFHDIQIVPGSRLAQLYPDTARDGVPEAIRLKPAPGRGYIAATQWHPEFHKPGSDTLDDTAILEDFLAACTKAKAQGAPEPHASPFRDRATRLLRRAMRKDRQKAGEQ
jgi:putative glutamine amidotransferase